jgi:hypothetical protein
MAMPQQYGAFVQTTNVWDVSQLQSIDVTSPEFKELLLRLYQNINSIALVLNIKDTGMYQLSEFVNGQLFFPNPANNSSTAQAANDRQVLRKVINIGALSNAGSTTVSHGITVTANTTFTRIYACASNTTNKLYIPIPNSGAFDASMEVTATNVVITTTVDLSGYNICYAVLEYLQS